MHFLDLANASRMGIYVHCGFDDGMVVFEELGATTRVFAQTPWTKIIKVEKANYGSYVSCRRLGDPCVM